MNTQIEMLKALIGSQDAAVDATETALLVWSEALQAALTGPLKDLPAEVSAAPFALSSGLRTAMPAFIARAAMRTSGT